MEEERDFEEVFSQNEDYSGLLVSENRAGYQEIGERTFQYALRVVKLCRVLFAGKDPIAFTLGKQLLRSGGSIGANVREAKSAESRADFLHKLGIALKEARETEYWIKLLIEAETISREQSESILDETDQIIAVLTAIIIKTKNKG